VETQALVWSAAYVVFVLACAGCAVRLLRLGAVGTSPLEADEAKRTPRPSASERLIWFGLTACASVALLATTNRVCQDIAVVPLLWVVPLALYLLSFVLTFAREDGYDRRVWGPPFLVLLALGAAVPFAGDKLPLAAAISLYCALLFATCMVCHGELFRRKPDPIRLTDFYLVVAAGGVAGGAFAALLAPVAFRSLAEFPLSLLGSYLLFAALAVADPASELRGARRVGAWSGMIAFGWVLGIGYFVPGLPGDGETTSRSFFGVHRIRDIDPDGPAWQRRFVHGSTVHGVQFMRGDQRRLPLSYFGRESGVGRVLDDRAAANEAGLNVGVVGLGAGTLASYGRAGDRYRFYEIDPSVVRIARDRFSFLEDSAAVVEIVLGDGRVSLEREVGDPERHPPFDVLVLDAFSSGAVPLHLLTAEAFDVYWARLDPQGVLVVQASNRYVDLARVVRDRAQARGEHAVLVHSPGDVARGLFPNSWVLVTRDESSSSESAWRAAATPWPTADRPPILWTDDRSDLFRALRRRITPARIEQSD
jgi:hypothetical protein